MTRPNRRSPEDWWPPHAYVPGRTPRHAETLFDPLKEGVATFPVHGLGDTAAWRAGIRFLRRGYYWEAHEVLEPVWMACPHNSAEKTLVQAVIQFANAALKQKMGRAEAADRLFRMSDDLLTEAFRRGGDRVLGQTRDEIGALLVKPRNGKPEDAFLHYNA